MGIYDIEKAFAAIEEELLSSMMRNMQRHRDWEDDEGFNWSMWQTEQLKSLELYKKQNRKKFPKQFKKINTKIEDAIQMAYDMGQMDEEIKILEAIKDGFKAKRVSTDTDFFKLNDRKLEALINATTGEIGKAETAILRMADDKYRQVIFNAQMYANTGAGTYEQAVDMATKDFISSGLNCVVYANGARHTLEDYARMAIRTAAKRAYLQGEGVKRAEWGVSTVIINKRGNPCPKCLPFVGKIMIDDVWSNGKKSDGKYPLLSDAIAKGLYHPNCRDSHTTYFPELSDLPEPYAKEDREEVFEVYQNDQKRKYAERQAEKYDRLARYALAPENKKAYAGKAKQWKTKKKLDLADFPVEPHVTGADIKNEVQALLEALEVLPDNVLQAAKGQTKFIVGERTACAYDIPRDIIHIAVGAKPHMIIHEFGHLVEAKLLDRARVKSIKDAAFRDVSPWAITPDKFHDLAGNAYERLILKDPRLISDYQGVILTDIVKHCFDVNFDLNTQLMTEYISEGFREFIENPMNLKAHDPVLFELFQEVLNAKD